MKIAGSAKLGGGIVLVAAALAGIKLAGKSSAQPQAEPMEILMEVTTSLGVVRVRFTQRDGETEEAFVARWKAAVKLLQGS